MDVVGEARDGEEAVALALELEPDLAIMDVKMPKLDGIDAARRIIDERPIPIVMLTAYGQDELVSRAVEAGVFGYLVKPFREADLLPAIQTARARHEELVGAARGGGVARGGAGGAQGDRAREGAADGEGGALGAGRVRAAPQGVAGLGPAAEGRRRGRRRDVRRAMTLTHLERPARGEPEGLLVLLHGRGADEHDLFPLLDVLDPERRLLGVTPRGAALAAAGRRALVRVLPARLSRTRRRSRPTYPQLVEWLDGLGFRAGADGARRLLAGRRDDVRARARRGPAAPGGADRAFVVHADRARASSSTSRRRCRRSRSGMGRTTR